MSTESLKSDFKETKENSRKCPNLYYLKMFGLVRGNFDSCSWLLS